MSRVRLLDEVSNPITLPRPFLPPHAEDNDAVKVRKSIQAQNRKILTAFQKSLGQVGLSPRMMEEHTANIAAFANEFLLAQIPPILLLDIDRAQLGAWLEGAPGNVNVVSFRRFVRFLRDTARMDYIQAEDLLSLLKSQ